MEFSTHQSENASWLNQLKQVRALKLQLKKGYPIGDIISKIGGQTILSYSHSAETFDAIATDYELMMNYMLSWCLERTSCLVTSKWACDYSMMLMLYRCLEVVLSHLMCVIYVRSWRRMYQKWLCFL